MRERDCVCVCVCVCARVRVYLQCCAFLGEFVCVCVCVYVCSYFGECFLGSGVLLCCYSCCCPALPNRRVASHRHGHRQPLLTDFPRDQTSSAFPSPPLDEQSVCVCVCVCVCVRVCLNGSQKQRVTKSESVGEKGK